MDLAPPPPVVEVKGTHFLSGSICCKKACGASDVLVEHDECGSHVMVARFLTCFAFSTGHYHHINWCADSNEIDCRVCAYLAEFFMA